MRKELRNYLDANGIMQKHIAKVMGVSESMVSAYLLGKEEFSEKRQIQLREYLDSKK